MHIVFLLACLTLAGCADEREPGDLSTSPAHAARTNPDLRPPITFRRCGDSYYNRGDCGY